MADLINLVPTDMTELDSLEPITFSVQSTALAVFVSLWVKYADSDDEVLIYNGTSFKSPFEENSSILRPLGNDSLINFSIVPELGWALSIDNLRVETNEALPPVIDAAALFPDDTANPPSGLKIASPSAGMLISNDITVELWCYPLSFPASGGTRQPLATRTLSSDINWKLGFSGQGSTIEFTYERTGGGTTRHHARSSGLGTNPTNQWIHLAATRNKATGTTTLFVNGVQVGTVLVQDPGELHNPAACETWLGRTQLGSSSSDFHGYMAEFRLWSAERTPAEIAANYNVALVGNEPNLVCYLPTQADFNDVTANGNNFTPVAGASQPAPAIVPFSRPF